LWAQWNVPPSPGFFGGINVAQQLRLVLAELGAPAIPSSFAISRVNEVFDDKGELVDERHMVTADGKDATRNAYFML
jgi:NAD(P)H-dependent FMN reductase